MQPEPIVVRLHGLPRSLGRKSQSPPQSRKRTVTGARALRRGVSLVRLETMGSFVFRPTSGPTASPCGGGRSVARRLGRVSVPGLGSSGRTSTEPGEGLGLQFPMFSASELHRVVARSVAFARTLPCRGFGPRRRAPSRTRAARAACSGGCSLHEAVPARRRPLPPCRSTRPRSPAFAGCHGTLLDFEALFLAEIARPAPV